MQYGPMERDMAILQHRFEIEHSDGKKVSCFPTTRTCTVSARSFVCTSSLALIQVDKQEIRTSTLLEYSDPDPEKVPISAMGRLVGIPCAVATMFVLDGTISTPGILAPMDPKINDPLMKALKEHGIECIEKTTYKET